MKQKKQIHIVFDMDNTLTDEFGKGVRPGVIDLLETLKKDDFYLSLWTSSTRNRAVKILRDHDLEQYFQSFVFRENYDPERKNLPKDIRNVDGDILIDDDPKQIKFVNNHGLTGLIVSAYRPDGLANQDELDKLLSQIRKANSVTGKLGRLFSRS